LGLCPQVLVCIADDRRVPGAEVLCLPIAIGHETAVGNALGLDAYFMGLD